jgi:hypothetical protein
MMKLCITQFVLYIVQFLATLYILGYSVVSYWRGTWMILDIYFYPKNRVIHGFICISVGSFTCLLCHLLRFPLNWLGRVKKFKQLSHSQLYSLTITLHLLQLVMIYFAAFAGVCMWKGMWQLMDLWIWPNKPEASAWLCHCIGVTVAVLLNSIVSLTAPPVLVYFENNDPNEIGDMNWIQLGLLLRFISDKLTLKKEEDRTKDVTVVVLSPVEIIHPPQNDSSLLDNEI